MTAVPAVPATPATADGLTTNQDLDPVRLRKAFGVFPSGVVAVAAEVDDVLVGLAASSFTSVSLDPPLVSFSVATTSKTWPDLRRATHVGVTVLAEHHGELCRQLAGRVDRRFDDVEVRVTRDGAVLLEEGLARFDCSVYREVEAGDHLVVLLELHAVEHDAEEQLPASPLVFHRSAFGRLSVPPSATDTHPTPQKRETR
jgi:flavin reductase (DIM6/NTAB) family NADH-FMN oxidoreductase RutF